MEHSEAGEVQSVRLDQLVDSKETVRAGTGAVDADLKSAGTDGQHTRAKLRISVEIFFYLQCTFESVRFMCLIVGKRSSKTREWGEIPP